MDHNKKLVRLQATSEAVEVRKSINKMGLGIHGHVEYGQWMIELVPETPIKTSKDISSRSLDFKNLMATIPTALSHGDRLYLAPVFPMIGVRDYFLSDTPKLGLLVTKEEKKANNEYSKSLYMDDQIIGNHPRFFTLTRNIIQRRESAVDIRIPRHPAPGEAPGEIHMDAMAFGMGSCALQSTFGAENYN